MIEVEAKDLPPGAVVCQTPDGERCYALPEMIRTRDEPVHPPFTGERLARLKRVYSILKDVHPGGGDFEQWHRNFRCNQSEEIELALYERIARVYLKLVTAATSRQRRRDIYVALVRLTVCDSFEAWRVGMGVTYSRLGFDRCLRIAQEWANGVCPTPSPHAVPMPAPEPFSDRTWIIDIGHHRSNKNYPNNKQ